MSYNQRYNSGGRDGAPRGYNDGGRGGAPRGYNDGGRDGSSNHHNSGSGGRARGGKNNDASFWSDKRSLLEREGLVVQTNCYELKPTNAYNDNATIYQYAVQHVALLKRREEDSSATAATVSTARVVPVASSTNPSFLVPKLHGHREEVIPSTANAVEDRSTSFTRRLLNHCQQRLHQVSYQSFVRFLSSDAASIFVALSFSLISTAPLTSLVEFLCVSPNRYTMVRRLRTLDTN
jgi:hypothetical protein